MSTLPQHLRRAVRLISMLVYLMGFCAVVRAGATYGGLDVSGAIVQGCAGVVLLLVCEGREVQ